MLYHTMSAGDDRTSSISTIHVASCGRRGGKMYQFVMLVVLEKWTRPLKFTACQHLTIFVFYTFYFVYKPPLIKLNKTLGVYGVCTHGVSIGTSRMNSEKGKPRSAI